MRPPTARVMNLQALRWGQMPTGGSAVAIDPQFREPAAVPTLVYSTIQGQIAEGATDRWSPRPLGDDPKADGHVVLRLADLPSGFAPRVGDAIVGLAWGTTRQVAVDWRVVEVRPDAHYGGEPRTLLCYYKDLKTITIGSG